MEEDRLSLLIVDDDVSFGHHIQTRLESTFTINTAHTISEAKKLLEIHEYHLILLDIGLGELPEGGLTLIHDVQESQTNGHIIILSGKDDTKTIIDSINRGAQDFVSKSNCHCMGQTSSIKLWYF